MPVLLPFRIDNTLSRGDSILLAGLLAPRQNVDLSAFIAHCTDESSICRGSCHER